MVSYSVIMRWYSLGAGSVVTAGVSAGGGAGPTGRCSLAAGAAPEYAGACSWDRELGRDATKLAYSIADEGLGWDAIGAARSLFPSCACDAPSGV